MFPRLFMALRWAKVVAVRSGVGRAGGEAAQWLVDLEDVGTGGRVPDCRVIGPRRPLVHTKERPSFGVYGCFAGNLHDPWFMPSPNASITAPAMHRQHELLDEFGGVAVVVEDGGAWAVRSRPDDAPLLVADPAGGPDDAATVRMLGGAQRIARGPDAAGNPSGDYIAIDGVTSPGFVAWLLAADVLLRALPGGGALPSLLPGDGVPAKDDHAEAPAVGVQVVGQVVTGSPFVKGK